MRELLTLRSDTMNHDLLQRENNICACRVRGGLDEERAERERYREEVAQKRLADMDHVQALRVAGWRKVRPYNPCRRSCRARCWAYKQGAVLPEGACCPRKMAWHNGGAAVYLFG